MQVASRECLWERFRPWTEVVLEMTEETGRYVRFLSNACDAVSEASVDWGDGSDPEQYAGMQDTALEHTYADFGRYTLRFRNTGRIGFRRLDGHAAQPYDAAVVSIVDYGGRMNATHSGGFSGAVRLERFIAPACTGLGQRTFAGCTSLREVELGECAIHYDGSFEGCTALTEFRTKATGTCWIGVWRGCTALEELDLGDVVQFALDDFADTPRLKDVTVGGRTVDQLLGRAQEGNIVCAYGSPFPWGASADCRFRCSDGVVLGSGERIA